MYTRSKPPSLAATSAQTPQLRGVDAAILTKREAANYVHFTTRYLERQIRVGRLTALKPTSRLVRIRRTDLEAFLEGRATIGAKL